MKTDIKRYEAMAKLSFDCREREWAVSSFERIVAGFEKLDGISTDGVSPLIYLSDTTNILREDETLINYITAPLTENAPDTENGYIRVPKAIE